ncbi:MAG: hypothetical protein R3C10_22700 [Pirellulales bacterium]
MTRHVLCAYADGSDLHEVAANLIDRISTFVDSRSWICSGARVVNQQGDIGDPSLGPDDLPDWDVGISFDLPDPGYEPPDWFMDVEVTVQFLAQLHVGTGRDFIIGICDVSTGLGDDLFFVQSASPNLAKRRQILGVRDMCGPRAQGVLPWLCRLAHRD